MVGLTFSSAETNQLFGPEAAEDEDPKRLREYYFKGVTYADVTARLPLRILVGHKGIGKSALFKIAMLEDADDGELPLLIRPDDIAELAKDSSDFLVTIRAWREGLNGIITRKILETFGLDQSGIKAGAQNLGGRLLAFVADSVKSIKFAELSLEPTKQLMLDKF